MLSATLKQRRWAPPSLGLTSWTLLNNSAEALPYVDNICSEFLKALNIIGLSWLTHLCNITSTLEGFLFKSGFNYRGIPLLSLHWSWCLLQVAGEGSLAISRTLDSRKTVGFLSWPGNTGPALYPDKGTLSDMGGCLTRVHVFCPSGEGVCLCSLICPVGDTPVIWGTGFVHNLRSSQLGESVCFGCVRILSLLFWMSIVLFVSLTTS